MGIVASLAAAPAAYDIIQDERIRDQERLVEEEEHIKKIKEAELYKLGDVELDLIKRFLHYDILCKLLRYNAKSKL